MIPNSSYKPDQGKFIVLTNGFVKKSQKTPKNDKQYREARLKSQKTENPIICTEKENHHE